MKKESLAIAALPVLSLLISILYYLCLILVMPQWLLTGFCLLAGLLLLFFLYQNIAAERLEYQYPKWSLIVAYTVSVAIVFMVAKNVLEQVSVFGHWDAWWFWNYRAKFLSDPKLWKVSIAGIASNSNFVEQMVAHPDYPPGVSSAVAFFWRLFPGYSMSVPFMIALCFGIAIPLILFAESYKRNIVVTSVVVLYFFAFNPFYAWHVSYMIGDIWISFFLLGTLISWNYFKKENRQSSLMITGVMLGGLLWSKNEGFVLVLLFALFHLKSLFSIARLRYLFTGLAVPLLMFLVFKIGYAPAGDLFNGDKITLTGKLLSMDRYKLIGHLFSNEVAMHFIALKWLSVLYVVYLIAARRFPANHFLFLIVAIAVYTMVYVISPHDLEWHVLTSMDRLMWHFVPAFIYVLLVNLPLEKFNFQRFKPVRSWSKD